MSLARRAGAEALGTGALLVAVVGSGIMGERLAGGNDAVALLANSVATGCALFVLVALLGPLSGAHFNPVVTLTLAFRRELPWRDVPAYLVAQVAFAILGVAVAHLMFGEALWTASERARSGWGQWLGEVAATAGLVSVVLLGSRQRPAWVPGLVAVYIAGAYWFTSSTAFANPAVTLARSMTATFTGIRPSDAPAFIASQLVGAALAVAACRWLVDAQRP